MKANWKLFRNKWTLATWNLLKKRRSLKRKVKLILVFQTQPTANIESVSPTEDVLTFPLSCPLSAMDCS